MDSLRNAQDPGQRSRRSGLVPLVTAPHDRRLESWRRAGIRSRVRRAGRFRRVRGYAPQGTRRDRGVSPTGLRRRRERLALERRAEIRAAAAARRGSSALVRQCDIAGRRRGDGEPRLDAAIRRRENRWRMARRGIAECAAPDDGAATVRGRLRVAARKTSSGSATSWNRSRRAARAAISGPASRWSPVAAQPGLRYMLARKSEARCKLRVPWRSNRPASITAAVRGPARSNL